MYLLDGVERTDSGGEWYRWGLLVCSALYRAVPYVHAGRIHLMKPFYLLVLASGTVSEMK